jgi:hypothetical protein
MKASGSYGLVAGLGSGLAIVFMAAFTSVLAFGIASVRGGGSAFGIAFGIASGLSIWLAFHGAPWTRYHITAVVNAMRGKAPLRFGAFLDWATQAGLLRISGIAYQFRHRQLQDWLMSQPETSGPGTS